MPVIPTKDKGGRREGQDVGIMMSPTPSEPLETDPKKIKALLATILPSYITKLERKQLGAEKSAQAKAKRIEVTQQDKSPGGDCIGFDDSKTALVNIQIMFSGTLCCFR